MESNCRPILPQPNQQCGCPNALSVGVITSLIYAYGVIPMQKALLYFEGFEDYETCCLIHNALNQYIEEHGLKFGTRYNDEQIKIMKGYLKELGLDGDKFTFNISHCTQAVITQIKAYQL